MFLKFNDFIDMNRKLFLTIAVLFSSICVLNAQAPDGLSCENAIPVDNSYEGTIEEAGTYYYRVSTYDLPLTCYFYPEANVPEAPVVYVDFTCTPGYYEDPNLDNMIKAADGWGLDVPVRFTLMSSVDEYNRSVYSLSIDASYRELMALFNVTYEVEAIVQVNAPCAGSVRMTPDTLFRSCAENSEWIALPTELEVGVQHEFDSYVLPFVDWQNDSIRFRWTGDSSPVTVWIGETCDFEFKTTGNKCALDMFVLNPDAGNNEHIRDFSKKEIQEYISLFGKGGLYYLRTVGSEDGALVIEPKPMSEDMSKAILLQPYETVNVPANATEQVYYFSTDYKDYSILLSSSVNCNARAYFSHSVSFDASDEDKSVIDSYMFAPAEGGSALQLSQRQMSKLCNAASTDYIFIKFVSDKAFDLTPQLWEVGSCGGATDEIQYIDSVTLKKRAFSTAWRVNINEWAKQDVMLYWRGASSLQMYLCDACKGFNVNATNEHVKLYKKVVVETDGSRDAIVLTKEELRAVASHADSDGFLYMFFDNSTTGALVVKPYVAEQPIPVSAALRIDSTFNLLAGEIDTVYHFTNAWKDMSVELVAPTTDTTNITAYFAATMNIDITGTSYIAAYPFTIEENQSRLQLSAKQISNLLRYSKDGKIYVVFHADRNVQVTPKLWSACDCVRESYELLLGASEHIPARSQDVVYRINYNQWKDYDVTLSWNGYTSMMAYLAYDCDFNLSADNKYVLNKEDIEIKPNDSIVIGENVRKRAIDMGLLPEDGFLYFRFYSTSAGTLSSSYTSLPVDPCELVKPFTVPSSLSLNTTEADSVYVFTPSTLVEDTVQFTWAGKSDLIMHIGTTCALPAEEATIYTLTSNTALRLGKDQLTKLAVDGKLYFRFIAKENANLHIEEYVAPVDPCELVKPFAVPSTLSLNAVEADSVYVLTPAALVEDSVQFTWAGTSELIMHIGTTCALPAEGATIYTLASNTALRFGKDQLTTLAVDGKLYFRFIAKESANLNIEEYVAPIPVKVIALALDSTINISAQSVNEVYYFTKDWSTISVDFQANTTEAITAYFGLNADFSIFSPDANYKVEYPFVIEEGINRLQLSDNQLNSMLTENAVDAIYVIFYADGATQITPKLWNTGAGVENIYNPKDNAKIYCTHEGVVYILVNGERYTILGEKF